MLAILNKELKTYFKSPIAYVFMTFFLVIFGIMFTFSNLIGRAPNYSNTIYASTIYIMFFCIPIITMRLLSEEKRQKTDQLLLTAPVNVKDMILGKYFAALSLVGITTLITVLQPISLRVFGKLPTAEIVGSYIGFILLSSTFIAIGLFMSSLTENQVVAAIATYVVFFLVLILDTFGQILPKTRAASIVFICVLVVLLGFIIYSAIKNIYISTIVAVLLFALVAALYFINPMIYDGLITKVFGWISLMNRYMSFSMGVFDVSSIVYYISFSIIFIFLSIQMVEKRRWS